MGTPYLGELRIMSFNFAPKGWALCNGQLLPIAQNQALFSLFGTTYGGDGRTTFALPDLRTRAPAHDAGTQGQRLGEYTHTLTLAETPQHLHALNADAVTAATSNAATPAAGNSFGQTVGKPSQGANFAYSMYSTTTSGLVAMAAATVSNTGGSQPHENRQPFLVLNICVALQGVFPSRN